MPCPLPDVSGMWTTYYENFSPFSSSTSGINGEATRVQKGEIESVNLFLIKFSIELLESQKLYIYIYYQLQWIFRYIVKRCTGF